MKINKVVKMTVYVYLTIYVVMPVTLMTYKLIKDKFETSELIKEIRKDFKLKKQGVITVDYQEIED